MAKIENGLCYELNSNVCLLSDFDKSALEFSCGNTAIDRYLTEKASSDNSCITYIFTDDDSGEVISFASLSCSGIIFQDGPHVEILPSVEIKYFAISEKYQHIQMSDAGVDHFRISDSVFCELLQLIRDITSLIGAEYIVLYSVPDAVSFYKRNCFEEFKDIFTPEHKQYTEGCVPMYMPL